VVAFIVSRQITVAKKKIKNFSPPQAKVVINTGILVMKKYRNIEGASL